MICIVDNFLTSVNEIKTLIKNSTIFNSDLDVDELYDALEDLLKKCKENPSIPKENIAALIEKIVNRFIDNIIIDDNLGGDE